MTSVEIPNRAVFRAQEVCEIADVQPYVLRTWESEFPDLGTSKGANGPRLYKRADVERVLRIKHLILVDGLTLAGARRRLGEEKPIEGPGFTDADVAALVDGALQQQLQEVRHDLRWILDVLSGHRNGGGGALPFDAGAAASSGRRAGGRESAPARASASKRVKAPPARAQKPASKATKARAGKKR